MVKGAGNNNNNNVTNYNNTNKILFRFQLNLKTNQKKKVIISMKS